MGIPVETQVSHGTDRLHRENFQDQLPRSACEKTWGKISMKLTHWPLGNLNEILDM